MGVKDWVRRRQAGAQWRAIKGEEARKSRLQAAAQKDLREEWKLKQELGVQKRKERVAGIRQRIRQTKARAKVKRGPSKLERIGGAVASNIRGPPRRRPRKRKKKRRGPGSGRSAAPRWDPWDTSW